MEMGNKKSKRNDFSDGEYDIYALYWCSRTRRTLRKMRFALTISDSMKMWEKCKWILNFKHSCVLWYLYFIYSYSMKTLFSMVVVLGCLGSCTESPWSINTPNPWRTPQSISTGWSEEVHSGSQAREDQGDQEKEISLEMSGSPSSLSGVSDTSLEQMDTLLGY